VEAIRALDVGRGFVTTGHAGHADRLTGIETIANRHSRSTASPSPTNVLLAQMDQAGDLLEGSPREVVARLRERLALDRRSRDEDPELPTR